MTKTILITGASSGIGTACVKQASALNLNVIATARSKDRLELLQNKFENIRIVIADISTESGRSLIEKSISGPLDYLLHNAAVLDAPQKLSDLQVSDFRRNIETNAEPILFLTQKLIKHFKKTNNTGRILSISSGAARYAIAGLGNYCVSKAAALMANQVLKAEMPNHGVIVNDYFPGTVDTNMQKTLRSSSTEIFPYSDEFKKLKTNNNLNSPDQVAHSILNIFTQTDDKDFAESEWVFQEHNVLDK